MKTLYIFKKVIVVKASDVANIIQAVAMICLVFITAYSYFNPIITETKAYDIGGTLAGSVSIDWFFIFLILTVCLGIFTLWRISEGKFNIRNPIRKDVHVVILALIVMGIIAVLLFLWFIFG